MKKNNDGYVLPFVLVVMIVLCIISTSLMTAALQNLQIQQRFTERMVDKYEAQGEIEKVVALLQQKIVVEGNEEALTAADLTSDKLSELWGLTSGNVCILEVTQTDTEDEEEETSAVDDQAAEKKPFDFTVRLKALSEATTIECELVLSAVYTSEQVVGTTYKHTITVEDLTYQSYEISTGGGT